MKSHTKSTYPYVRDLVLLGAGHANVQVLRYYGMYPQPGIRVTVVAREPHSPYSGMLPGYVYGRYSWEEIHIDLAKLTTYANARLIAAEALRVNPEQNVISFEARPDLRYDCLAINTGGEPGIKYRHLNHVVPVKPIGKFTKNWERILTTIDPTKQRNLTIVGGGPGSVEVALAIRELHGNAFAITLVTADPFILAQHNRGVRRITEKELARSDIEYRINYSVSDIDNTHVTSENGDRIKADLVLWVAGVEAPSWISESGFDVDRNGFIKVDRNLRSLSHNNVFAAGDMVCLVGQERPKSGVYAVRAGPILSQNTHRFLAKRRLKKYNAQRLALAILRLPDNQALASKGPLCLKSKLISVWKHRIDVKFMQRFERFPMVKPAFLQRKRFKASKELATSMRCGGCGSKLGANLLDRVLKRLGTAENREYLTGIGDDSAIVEVRTESIAATCDQFRSMVTDPYRFGRISANHALNDLYAMGSEPSIALAMVTIPLMNSTLMEEDLYQTLAGALYAFRQANVQLVGGHSAEGPELAIGFAVIGSSPTKPFFKSNMLPGQDLILTKPLGTGLILAGNMHRKTRAMDLVNCIEIMEQSNAEAASIFANCEASVMTDVTGFGLLGHVAELSLHSSVRTHLNLSKIPLMSGVKELVSANIRSSLHDSNQQVLPKYDIAAEIKTLELVPLLDPQTCGGLIAAVPKNRTGECLAALRKTGYTNASIVGSTFDSGISRVVV